MAPVSESYSKYALRSSASGNGLIVFILPAYQVLNLWQTKTSYRPFFMAHLKKLPTYFVKGDKRRAAYYTIQARELRAEGYIEEGEKAVAAKPIERLPEIVNEAGAEPYDSTESLTEPVAETLEEMTKAELLEWAMDRGHDLPNNDKKADILQACKEIEAAQ